MTLEYHVGVDVMLSSLSISRHDFCISQTVFRCGCRERESINDEINKYKKVKVASKRILAIFRSFSNSFCFVQFNLVKILLATLTRRNSFAKILFVILFHNVIWMIQLKHDTMCKCGFVTASNRTDDKAVLLHFNGVFWPFNAHFQHFAYTFCVASILIFMTSISLQRKFGISGISSNRIESFYETLKCHRNC